MMSSLSAELVQASSLEQTPALKNAANREYGVGVARRGWAEKKDILTTLPLDTLRARLKRD